MNKAIKYRIYPTTEQTVLLLKTFGCCRKVWNLMLADKIAFYEQTGSMLKNTPAQYKASYPFLREVDSLALANEQLHLQAAYNAFFKNKSIGFPNFKSAKRSKRAYTTNNQKGTIALAEKGIKLPKLGIVKAKLHRLPKTGWILKSATISQESDGKFYASVLFEYEAEIKVVPVSDNAIGLDYKSDGLYMDSNGIVGSNHKFYRESYTKLFKAQKKLSRMIEANIIGYKAGPKGGRVPIYKKPLSECKNIVKQRLRVAKISRHVAHQRLDNLHKKSTEIANLYDVVCVESLNMKAIANRGFGNGKATLDNGYGMFLNMLEYKLYDRGKHFVKVDKWFPSSQLCSCCGNCQKLALSARTYTCRSCGIVIDRDYNAALNIKNEGLRLLSQAV